MRTRWWGSTGVPAALVAAALAFAALAALAPPEARAAGPSVEVSYTRAVVAYERSDWVHAASSAREALALRPDHVPALRLLGLALAQLEQHEDAVAALGHALEAGAPADVRIEACPSFVALQRYQGCLDALEPAAPLLGTTQPFLYWRGYALLWLGRHSEAADALEAATKDPGPLRERASYFLGAARTALGQDAAARAAFASAASGADADAARAARQLTGAASGGTHARDEARGWNAYFTLGALYDSNPNVAPSDPATGIGAAERSAGALLQAGAGVRPLRGRDELGASVDALRTLYIDGSADDWDLTSVDAELHYQRRIDTAVPLAARIAYLYALDVFGRSDPHAFVESHGGGLLVSAALAERTTGWLRYTGRWARFRQSSRTGLTHAVALGASSDFFGQRLRLVLEPGLRLHDARAAGWDERAATLAGSATWRASREIDLTALGNVAREDFPRSAGQFGGVCESASPAINATSGRRKDVAWGAGGAVGWELEGGHLRTELRYLFDGRDSGLDRCFGHERSLLTLGVTVRL